MEQVISLDPSTDESVSSQAGTSRIRTSARRKQCCTSKIHCSENPFCPWTLTSGSADLLLPEPGAAVDTERTRKPLSAPDTKSPSYINDRRHVWNVTLHTLFMLRMHRICTRGLPETPSGRWKGHFPPTCLPLTSPKWGQLASLLTTRLRQTFGFHCCLPPSLHYTHPPSSPLFWPNQSEPAGDPLKTKLCAHERRSRTPFRWTLRNGRKARQGNDNDLAHRAPVVNPTANED